MMFGINVDKLINRVLSMPVLRERVIEHAVLGDKGYGDTLARLINEKTLNSFPKLFAYLSTMNCNCPERQAALNKEFAYPNPEQLPSVSSVAPDN